MLLAAIGRDITCLEAANLLEAQALIAQHGDLQICLLDLTLKDEHGLDAIHSIKSTAPQMAVVVVSGVEESAMIRQCIDAGAMSFIPKSVAPEVLTHALQQVLNGVVYLPEQIVNAMSTTQFMPPLTPRQLQVLNCLSRGLPTKLISRELALSEHTIKEYIALVFQALGVRNRTEAVIKASRLRLQECAASARR